MFDSVRIFLTVSLILPLYKIDAFFICSLSIPGFDTSDRKTLCLFESSAMTGLVVTSNGFCEKSNVPDFDLTLNMSSSSPIIGSEDLIDPSLS